MAAKPASLQQQEGQLGEADLRTATPETITASARFRREEHLVIKQEQRQ